MAAQMPQSIELTIFKHCPYTMLFAYFFIWKQWLAGLFSLLFLFNIDF